MCELRMVTVRPFNRDVVLGTHERDEDFTVAESRQLQPVAGPDNRSADYAATLTARRAGSPQCRRRSVG